MQRVERCGVVAHQRLLGGLLASQHLIVTTRGVTGGSFVAHPDAEQLADALATGFTLLTNSADVGLADMLELRRDDVRHFAGSYLHKLKKTKSGYAIKLQRVDMTNAQAAYDYVLQVWV